MNTSIEPAPAGHVWVGIQALAAHALKHHLGAPLNMTPETSDAGPCLWVHVEGDDEPNWFATLNDPVGNYEDERTTPQGVVYLHAVTTGTLPDTGVRVRVTANILRPRNLVAVQ